MKKHIRKFNLVENTDWKLYDDNDVQVHYSDVNERKQSWVHVVFNSISIYGRPLTMERTNTGTWALPFEYDEIEFPDIIQAIEHVVQIEYNKVKSEIKNLELRAAEFKPRSLADVTVESLENYLDNMTPEQEEQAKKFFEDKTPKGWIPLEKDGHIPMMLALDFGGNLHFDTTVIPHQIGSPFKVKNAEGKVWWELVGDGMIWQYIALDKGVTHWYNPTEEEFDEYRNEYFQSF